MSQEAPPTPAEPTAPAAAPETAAAPPVTAPPTSQPGGTRSDRSESTPSPGAAPAAGVPDEIPAELRDRVFAAMTDEDMKNHPALRDRYNKFVTSTQRKLEDQAKAREEETRRYVAMDAEVERLERNARAGNSEELLAALADPASAANIARVKAWRQTRQASDDDLLAKAANTMVDGLVTSLKEDEDWADLSENDWNEIFSDRDVKKVLARLVVAGTAKERKSLQAKAKAEIEAGINEALTKRNLSITSPESPHGAVVGGGNGGLTLEQYSAMTPTERRALRRDNPQAIDAMTSSLIEAQLAPATNST